MSECPSLQGCPFFNDNMKDSVGMGAIYKKKYCLGDNTQCARFLVSKTLGKTFVPQTLYPNMHLQAQKIISEHKT